ncbi:MAG: PilZ domain-containing protein [Gammaproteobacteria bacterium]|nr:PilZ domain-containing protein [Gammaproteobacteria bacterium]
MGFESCSDTTAEVVMAEEEKEKRSFSRIGIHARVEYRVLGHETYRQGMLENLSASGALLWTEQQLPLDSEIKISITSDETDELPINITALVVRIADAKKESRFGYGCQIKSTENA